MGEPIFLGVNVDHIATLRQARGTRYPDPVHAALEAERAGADGITMHLREDRRHIQDCDVERFAEMTQTKLNLEVASTPEMIAFALKVQPRDVCIVPEKREELTTEGGLNVLAIENEITALCETFSAAKIQTSLFIDPDYKQIDAAVRCGAPVVEIHTGRYADAHSTEERKNELALIQAAAKHAAECGLVVNAGHGLHTHNIQPIAAIPTIHELNIGHALISDATFSGISMSVQNMKRLMIEARQS